MQPAAPFAALHARTLEVGTTAGLLWHLGELTIEEPQMAAALVYNAAGLLPQACNAAMHAHMPCLLVS